MVSVTQTVLSIDTFRGNADGQKSQAVFTYAKNHKSFDILPSMPQYHLKDYLNSFQNKKVIKRNAYGYRNVNNFRKQINPADGHIKKSGVENPHLIYDLFYLDSWQRATMR